MLSRSAALNPKQWIKTILSNDDDSLSAILIIMSFNNKAERFLHSLKELPTAVSSCVTVATCQEHGIVVFGC